MNRRSALEGVDPAVASILGDAAKKQRMRRLPKDEQARARREAARERGTYDMPGELKDEIEKLARQEGISASALASLLLAEGVRRLKSGEISLYGTKRASRCPRVDWVVDESTVLDVLSGKIRLSDGNGKVWQ